MCSYLNERLAFFWPLAARAQTHRDTDKQTNTFLDKASVRLKQPRRQLNGSLFLI